MCYIMMIYHMYSFYLYHLCQHVIYRVEVPLCGSPRVRVRWVLPGAQAGPVLWSRRPGGPAVRRAMAGGTSRSPTLLPLPLPAGPPEAMQQQQQLRKAEAKVEGGQQQSSKSFQPNPTWCRKHLRVETMTTYPLEKY